MEKLLCEVVSNFKVFSMKVHSLHVTMTGDGFLTFHTFLGEMYTFLEESTDGLLERMEQLGYPSPTSLEEQIEESGIKELGDDSKGEDKEDDGAIEDRRAQLPVVQKWLLYMIDCLQEGIETSGEEKDYVTQNDLIDLQKEIGIFEWKVRRMMGKRFN